MTSSNLEGWYYVQIVLKSLVDGTTTKTVKLSNRPIIEEATGATVYYPILKSIDNIGSELGQYIPQPHSGTIVIDNSPHSFGYERRFSDLLERYTVTGAAITIYSALTTIDDIAIAADFSLDWTTTGISWEQSGDDIRISVAEQSLSNRVITKLIDRAEFPDAADSSIGKYLPLVFGYDYQFIKPLLIIDGTAPTYALSSQLGYSYSATPTIMYAKDSTGTYVPISTPTDINTPVFENGVAISSTYDLSGGAVAFKIQGTGAALAYILRGGIISLHGNNTAGTVSGAITIEICPSFVTNGIQSPLTTQILGRAIVNKAAYAANWNAASDFDVEFSFDKYIVISPTSYSSYYWVIVSGANESGASLTKLNLTTTGASTMWQKGTSDSTFGITTTVRDLKHEFYAVDWQYNTTAPDALGLAATTVEFSQRAAASDQTNCSLSSLDVLVGFLGMQDDQFTGVISGTPSHILTAPHHIIQLLDTQWDGSEWQTTGATVDVSRFSTEIAATCEDSTASTSKQFARQISGYSEGRQTVASLMELVCKSAAMKITRYNGASKQFTLYPWGVTQTAKATISDEDCQIVSLRQLGSDGIVNRATLQFSKDIRYADIGNATQAGSLKQFYQTRIFDIDDGGVAAFLSTTSVALFGTRELADINFEFISSQLSNFYESIGYYYLSNFAFPPVYCEIEIPLYKYRARDLLDVVNIVSPKLPAYFGTSANGRQPYYQGGAVDANLGFPVKRANIYRAMIEGKTLNYTGDFPTMRLNCRLLIAPNDPT